MVAVASPSKFRTKRCAPVASTVPSTLALTVTRMSFSGPWSPTLKVRLTSPAFAGASFTPGTSVARSSAAGVSSARTISVPPAYRSDRPAGTVVTICDPSGVRATLSTRARNIGSVGKPSASGAP